MFTKQILLTLLTAGWVVFIFHNSLENAADSSRQSGTVLQLIESIFRSFGISVSISEHFIRKLAHFTEYTALGILLGVTLRSYTKKMAVPIFIPLFAGLAVPVADEYIQAFVDGRGSMVQDVVLDFAGSCAGLCAAALCIALYDRRKHSRKKQGKRK